MLNKNAKYNFDANLISASYNKELTHSKKEWVFIYEEKRDKQDGVCICQRKVKNIIYMYNIKTKKTIIVGSACHKKFNMESSKVDKFLLNILKPHLEKGEYLLIDNIITYSKSIQEQLIKTIQNKFDDIINNYKQINCLDNGYILTENNYVPKNLKELSQNIRILIREYELEYLQDIYLLICNKINEIYEERKKYEESKIYCVKTYVRNYMPGMGTDYFEKQYYYTSLEKCNEHISKCPTIGVTEYSGYGWSENENTYLKIEILCKYQIIKIIGEEVYEKYIKYNI